MSSRLTLLNYVSRIKPFSNQVINLQMILSPFGLWGSFSQEGTILVGQLIEELCSRLDLDSMIDIPVIVDIILKLETSTWIDNLREELLVKEDDTPISFQNVYDHVFKALII